MGRQKIYNRQESLEILDKLHNQALDIICTIKILRKAMYYDSPKSYINANQNVLKNTTRKESVHGHRTFPIKSREKKKLEGD